MNMLFAPDTEAALRSAVELVNGAGAPDTLTTLEDLERWWTSYGYTGRHDRDDAELAALRALRPRLRELLTADRDDAAQLVNAALAAWPALRQDASAACTRWQRCCRSWDFCAAVW